MMRRRTGMLRIFMNAFASANPSDVLMKSMMVLGEAIMCFESPPAGMSSSKKNATGTCRIWAMSARTNRARARLVFLNLLKCNPQGVAEFS
jgi:hypothetical protein